MTIKYGKNKSHPFIFGADFETDLADNGLERFVCQWAISPGNESIEKVQNGVHPYAWTGRNLDTFEQTLMSLAIRKKHIMVYFHNLAYDQSYFFPMLKHMKDTGWVGMEIIKDGDPIMLQYECADMTIEFRDSKMKLNKELKQIGAMLGCSKLMPPDEDFHPGWSKSIDYSNMKYDQPDWIYVSMDAYICCAAMKLLHSWGYTRPTYSSDAYTTAKETVDRHFKGRWLERFPPLPVESWLEGKTPEELSEALKVAKIMDKDAREAYWGGINYSAHKGVHMDQENRHIFHVDYHSMYPSQMKYRPLPYGNCKKVLVGGDGGLLTPDDYLCEYGDVYIAQLRVTKMKLKEGRIPWYHVKDLSGGRSTKPLEELDHPVIITAADLEWHDILDFYDVEFTSEPPEDMPEWQPRYWVYRTHVGDLAEHIDNCYSIKEKEDTEGRKNGLMYDWSKVLMNSVYGRMAMHPKRDIVSQEWDEELGWYRWVKTDQEVNEKSEAYLPYPIYVCAWARHQLLQAWKAVGCENVIHSDTDSVVFFADRIPDGLELTASRLDTWGNEQKAENNMYGSSIACFIEIGVKRYIECTRWPIQALEDVSMAFAGVPQKTKVFNGVKIPVGMWVEILDDPLRMTDTSEPIVLGQKEYRIKSKWLRDLYVKAGKDPDHVNTMKLMKRTMPGGMDLMETTWTLKDHVTYLFR